MRPMLATRGDHVPPGADWVHEVKWDGIRVLVDVADGRVRVTSRSESDITVGLPELAGLSDLGHDMLLDGEVVALSSGRPSFGAIVPRVHVTSASAGARLAATEPATLIAFDLLRLGGQDLCAQPLSVRRERLVDLGLDGDAWQVPPSYDDGAMLLQAVEEQGLEGIVSKKRSSRYHPDRRSKDWLKFPIRPNGSYVVGGFRYETGSSTRLGALLVGEPTPDGLVFRGRVGSGVAGRAGQALGELLLPQARPTSPFAEALPRADAHGTVWVEPVVVVDLEFMMVTADGRLRQPAYRGVRGDLAAEDLGEQ
ncbi:MAG: Bifunctional non-ous end joining protein LigD [Marmoricola sp.]|nr:Bifunctional non-ous end joining protein LigD [Marmoricola sp.]